MMKLFLTSNIGGIQKENDKKIPIKFFEKNEFLNNLKNCIKDYEKFVLIVSNPDSYEKNDLFLQMDIEALKLSGLSFKENLILDERGIGNVENILKDASLIFLSGGNTFTQNMFFNNIKLKEYLKHIDTVIVGISAGSINAPLNVYNSPEYEEDLKNSPYLKGLDLTKFNIEPHFILDDDYNKSFQGKEILKESFKRPLIALTDGAYILEIDNKSKLYGEAYCIKDGKIKNICKDGECLVLNDNSIN